MSFLESFVRCLGLREQAVAIRVVFGQHLLERWCLLLLSRVAADLPSIDVDGVAREEGNAFQLPCEPSHPPQLLARLQVVCHHSIGAGHDYLGLAAGRAKNPCRPVAPGRLGPVRLPNLLAGLGIERDQVRADLLIAHDQELAVGDNRGRSVPVLIDERTHGVPPQLIAFEVIRQCPEVPEENEHALPVRDWRRRSRAVCPLEMLAPRPRGLADPEHLAGVAIQGQNEQLFVFVGGQEDLVSRDNRG